MEEKVHDSPHQFPEARKSGDALSAILALFLACAPLVYLREVYELYDLPKRLVFTVGGFGFAAVLLAARALARRSFRLPGEAIFFLAFLAAAVVALFRSLSPAEGVDLVRDGFQLMAWWLTGALLLSTPKRLRNVLWGIAAAGVFTALLGLLQYAGFDSWSGKGAAYASRGLGAVLPFENLPQVDKPASAFGHVNMAAEVVLLGFLAAIGLLLPRLAQARRAGGWRLGAGDWTMVAALAAQAGFLLVAGSRAAWIGAVAGSTWLLFRTLADAEARLLRRPLLRTATLLVAFGLAAFLLADQYARVPGRGGQEAQRPSDRLRDLLTLEDGTEHERLVLWRNTARMIEHAPVLGVGPGNWKIEYPRWSRAEAVLGPDRFGFARQPEATHMESLQLLSETGIIGFVLFGVFFVGAFWRLAWRRRPGDAASPAPRHAASAMIVGALAVSVAAYVFQNPVPSAMAFLLLGAGAGLRPSRGGPTVSPAVSAGAAVVTTVLLLVATSSLWGRVVASSEYLVALENHEDGRMGRTTPGGPTPRQLLVSALDRLDRAAAREPSDYRIQTRRALVLWDLGLGDAAANVFDRVLALHPNFLNALVLKAQLVMRREGDTMRYFEARNLLDRALRIQPEAPEIHYAIGHVFDTYAREIGDAYGANLSLAVKHYREAARLREYSPWARIGLVRILLDHGGDLGEILEQLAKATENASSEPDMLIECARLYGHPRLTVLSGLFGPAGTMTLHVWRRVLDLTRHRQLDAVLEIAMERLNLWHVGGPLPEEPALRNMLEVAEDVLAHEPGHVLARYYRALIFEGLGEPEAALRDWGILVRSGRSVLWRDARMRQIIEEAVNAHDRIVELSGQGTGATPSREGER